MEIEHKPLTIILNLSVAPFLDKLQAMPPPKPKPKKKPPEEYTHQNGNKSLRELLNSGV